MALHSGEEDTEAIQSLLDPFDEGDLECWPVSTLVNSPKNDVAECIGGVR